MVVCSVGASLGQKTSVPVWGLADGGKLGMGRVDTQEPQLRQPPMESGHARSGTGTV